MSSPGDEADVTTPPRQPRTPRTFLRRAWAATKAAVQAHPDRALAFGLGALAVGVLWAVF